MGWAEVQRDAFVIGVDILETRVDLRDDLRHVILGEDPALGRIVVFPQRVALKRFMRENAAQVRMTVENDAIHVEHFALVPVQAFENRGPSFDRLVLRHANLETNALVVLQRVELVNEIETTGSWLSVVGFRLSMLAGGGA